MRHSDIESQRVFNQIQTSCEVQMICSGPPYPIPPFQCILPFNGGTCGCGGRQQPAIVRAAAISKREAARNDRIARMKEEKKLSKAISGLFSGYKEGEIGMNLSGSPASLSSEPSGCGLCMHIIYLHSIFHM